MPEYCVQRIWNPSTFGGGLLGELEDYMSDKNKESNSSMLCYFVLLMLHYSVVLFIKMMSYLDLWYVWHNIWHYFILAFLYFLFMLVNFLTLYRMFSLVNKRLSIYCLRLSSGGLFTLLRIYFLKYINILYLRDFCDNISMKSENFII